MVINRFKGQYAFLSNFYPIMFEYDGVLWKSSEHAYQASKSDDPEVRERIRRLGTASATKRVAKTITVRPDFHEQKIDIMYAIVKAKFEQNSPLRELLLYTGNDELVEGNTWGDVFWGVCNDVGENHLGKILMRVREELRGTAGQA